MITSPKIVAILNITPDSFSDGDKFYRFEDAITSVQEMVRQHVDVIDVGAESTRPHGVKLDSEEEIARLERIIPAIKTMTQNTDIKISLDSRNYATIKRFIDDIDIINDVTGVESSDIQQLGLDYGKEIVFMHSLSVPVKPGETVPKDLDIVGYLQQWFDQKVKVFDKKGFDRKKLIFDPGIGFGLDAEQSMSILKRIREFKLDGVKIMIGHSRKSFLSQFGELDAKRRDPETHALTLYLVGHNVDYIRVHDFTTTRRVVNLAQNLYS